MQDIEVYIFTMLYCLEASFPEGLSVKSPTL